MKQPRCVARRNHAALSVSSYGSCGVKHLLEVLEEFAPNSFSILLRIVRGETILTSSRISPLPLLSVSSYGSCGVKPLTKALRKVNLKTFSILLRIVRGETRYLVKICRLSEAFSILLRIVRGETVYIVQSFQHEFPLSVSSYGSCGVKHNPQGAKVFGG